MRILQPQSHAMDGKWKINTCNVSDGKIKKDSTKSLAERKNPDMWVQYSLKFKLLLRIKCSTASKYELSTKEKILVILVLVCIFFFRKTNAGNFCDYMCNY